MVEVFTGKELGVAVDPMRFLNQQVVIRLNDQPEAIQMKCLGVFGHMSVLAGPDTEGYARMIKFSRIEQIELL